MQSYEEKEEKKGEESEQMAMQEVQKLNASVLRKIPQVLEQYLSQKGQLDESYLYISDRVRESTEKLEGVKAKIRGLQEDFAKYGLNKDKTVSHIKALDIIEEPNDWILNLYQNNFELTKKFFIEKQEMLDKTLDKMMTQLKKD